MGGTFSGPYRKNIAEFEKLPEGVETGFELLLKFERFEIAEKVCWEGIDPLLGDVESKKLGSKMSNQKSVASCNSTVHFVLK